MGRASNCATTPLMYTDGSEVELEKVRRQDFRQRTSQAEKLIKCRDKNAENQADCPPVKTHELQFPNKKVEKLTS